MRIFRLAVALGAAALCTTVMAQQPPAQPAGQPPSAAAPQGPPPMHVYIRSGLKTHGPGQHDYPQFLADWSKILTERGAIVDGSLHFPTAAELATTDVHRHVQGRRRLYDAGGEGHARGLPETRRRHSSASTTRCAARIPSYYSTIVGGAKKHGEMNYTLEADVPYTIVDTANPIMQGMSNFTIKDEAFFLMTWAKAPADPSAGDGDDGRRRRARRATKAKSCRRSGPTRQSLARRPAVPRVRLDAGTQLRELRRPRRFSRCCCAASRGRPSSRSTR